MTKGKRILIHLLPLILITISLSTFDAQSKHKIKSVKNEVIQEVVPSSEHDTYVSPISDLKNAYSNPDIISKIQIDEINLDAVITKSSDNKFYLNHDAYRNENEFGSPYVDFRNGNNLDEERQINIYSHNYYDDSYNDYLPFSKLENYLSKDVFDKAREIYLLTEEKKIKYEVYALKIITDNNEHMILDANSETDWQHHLDRLLEDTTYCIDDCHLSSDAKLLVLQTCNYNPKGSFLLVIAKKVL